MGVPPRIVQILKWHWCVQGKPAIVSIFAGDSLPTESWGIFCELGDNGRVEGTTSKFSLQNREVTQSGHLPRYFGPALFLHEQLFRAFRTASTFGF